jgi:hypothetical protein
MPRALPGRLDQAVGPAIIVGRALMAGRALMVGRALILGAALLLGGCIDFVDPEIPHAGTPATLQVGLVLGDERTADAQAQLAPGYDDIGLPRPVIDETLRILGHPIEPVERRDDGTLVYQMARAITAADALGPVEIVPPTVSGTTAPDPIAWVGIGRIGPDTIHVPRDADIGLDLHVPDGGTAPIRQWFLQMQGAGPPIRVSSDGTPPDRLVLPAVWVPEPDADGIVRVTLSYVQSATTASPGGDYVVAISLQTRLAWTVMVGTQAELVEPGAP